MISFQQIHVPVIIMVMGLPGSGKTYFAKHLSERLGTLYLGSDQTRKEMDAMGKYSERDKLNVYEAMRSQTQHHVQMGKSVVLDATFYKAELRLPFEILAKRSGVPIVRFWIEAPVAVIRERVTAKREDSEADFEVYKKLATAFEPPSMPYLKLTSTQDNLYDMLKEAEQYLEF